MRFRRGKPIFRCNVICMTQPQTSGRMNADHVGSECTIAESGREHDTSCVLRQQGDACEWVELGRKRERVREPDLAGAGLADGSC